MNACCEDQANREEGPGPRGGEEQDGLTITHCRVCECRHFEVTLDPGALGLVGTEM